MIRMGINQSKLPWDCVVEMGYAYYVDNNVVDHHV